MANAFLHGNGGANPLTFRVFTGSEAPSNPRDLDIWVKTSSAVTEWYFGVDEPNVVLPRIAGSSNPWNMRVPKKLADGDILNFVIPASAYDILEALVIVDAAGEEYYVRNSSGGIIENWTAGTKVGLRVTRASYPIGGYGSGAASALCRSYGSYYHRGGAVWISTGTYSTAAFNALKKNGLQIYPLRAKLSSGSSWSEKPAKTYMLGEWVDWRLYLYKNGDRNLPVTGDFWHGSTVVSEGTADDGTKFLDFPSPGLDEQYTNHIGNAIDLTVFNRLVLQSVNAREAPGDTVQIVDSGGNVVVTYTIPTNNNDDIFTYTVDISALKGSYTIRFSDYGNGYDNWDLYELYLE